MMGCYKWRINSRSWYHRHPGTFGLAYLPGEGFCGGWLYLPGGTALSLSAAANLACGVAATPTLVPTATPTPTPPPPTSTPEPGTTVRPDDPRLQAGPVEFPGDAGAVKGYLARPQGNGPFPAMLVVHENQGLLPHFADVARRLALEGYAALAVDLVSRKGGTLDPEQGITALREIPSDQLLADANAAVRYLQGQSYVRADRVGVTGFCFGGGISWLLAVRNPGIRAAVPFYGSAPPIAEVPGMKAAVLGIYAGNDNRINAGVPDLEAALKQNQKTYELMTYPGVDHAFFNDTKTQYNAAAAGQAWTKAMAWLDQHLKK
ncbi:MAG: dienelactone hydrolase family protein [SAR202 cluster bacterium]|nr:dienelactone hydrolase family protein [SAR202 cluster bacterium]